MVRGKLAIITTEGKILSSTEFNGSMFYDGNGRDAYERLDSIDHVEEYEDFVQEFNDEYYKYGSVSTYEYDESVLDMQDDYLGKWFSDFVYIKNLSDKSVIITDANGERLSLNPDITMVLYFGEFVAASLEDYEAIAFIDNIEGMKDKLTYDSRKNYSEIWNMCSDYDSEHSGVYLTDRIQEHDFVDEEILEYIVNDNATDVSRLRCFINDTYDDDIYMLDGYGNLANVDSGDFESLIDDLIDDLKNNISVPTAKHEACL